MSGLNAAASQRTVALRCPQPGDIPILAALRSDKNAQHLLLAHPEAASSGDVAAWLERRRADANGYFAIVAVRETDQAIGFVQLTELHRLDRHAFAGIALVASARGAGFGRRAMIELIRTAHVDYRLRKVLLRVRADNDAALRLYKSLSFGVIGVMRDHYDDGDRLHDVFLLESILELARLA